MSSEGLREILRVSFARALESLDLTAQVARAMATVGRPPPSARAVTVFAVGKAATAMARGVLPLLEGRIAHALVVEPVRTPPGPPEGAATPRPSPSGIAIERLEAPHPHPDRRSVAAAQRALQVIRSSDFAIALVSGGASSLICLPRPLPLSRYVRIVRALLLAGATVRDVNVVRRHLCSVKGGGLARLARGPLHTLVASDVIGGGLHDVGSGPTVPDPTTCAEARAVLRRFAPRLVEPSMRESLKPRDPQARRLHARLVARPEQLAEAVAGELRRCFARARVIEPSVAPAEELAREYLARARRLRRGEAIARAAEPSLRVEAARPGRGGRATHLAMLVGRDLPEGVAFLAGASDGVDGSSGTAGAVVDASLRAVASSDAIARALAAFDTGPILSSTGMALPLGLTGHNLADLHILARGDP